MNVTGVPLEVDVAVGVMLMLIRYVEQTAKKVPDAHTVRVALLDVTPPPLALMLVEPALTPVAKPVPSIVPTPGSLDVQASAPKVAAVPSVKVPVALYCFVLPCKMQPVNGMIERVASCGALTVRVALLEVTPFIEAVMVVLPCAKVEAMPLAFSVATVVSLDAQVTDPETLPVLPSE